MSAIITMNKDFKSFNDDGVSMKLIKLRPFLLATTAFAGLLLLLVMTAPVWLVTAVLPLVNVAEAMRPVPVTQEANIVPGRATWLFVLKSEIGTAREGMVVQYLHWYPDAETAAANWAQNKYGSQDKFPGDPAQYVVPLDGSDVNEVLLCVGRGNGRLLCEYRAQAGHWTMHADFVSNDQAIFSNQQIKNLTALIFDKYE